MLLWLLGLAMAAPLEVGRPFQPNMVLQRDKPNPIWGRSTPGETVRVQFGPHVVENRVRSDGRWVIELPAMEVQRVPVPLTISSGADEIVLRNVLVGDVWLCAGQSNMQWRGARDPGLPRGKAWRDDPLLRLYGLQPATRAGANPFGDRVTARLGPEKFFSGSWRQSTQQSADAFSAVGWWFGTALRRELDVPIGVVCAFRGGSPAEAWISEDALAASPTVRSMVAPIDWRKRADILGSYTVERGQQNLAAGLKKGTIPTDERGPVHPFRPTYLWDQGIAPLAPLAIRGIVWYQGETNAETAERTAQHEVLLGILIDSWRKTFGDPRMPFAVVQLPGIRRPHWPAFRETQRRVALSRRDVGLVVTIDTGLPNNVHPPEKREVGERIARWALVDVYGRDGQAGGPRLEKVRRQGDKLVLSWQRSEGLATGDGKAPGGFELAGKDGEYQPAEARLDGDTVTVWSDAVPKPHRVRYLWAPWMKVWPTLVNRSGLPAAPFEARVGRDRL